MKSQMETWQNIRDKVPDSTLWQSAIIKVADFFHSGCKDCLSHSCSHILCHLHVKHSNYCCRCTRTVITEQIVESFYTKKCMDCLGTICPWCLLEYKSSHTIDLCANNDLMRVTPIRTLK